MDPIELKKSLKKLIQKGKLDEALNEIIEFSRSEEGYSHLENTAINNLLMFKDLESDKADNSISTSEYNVAKSNVRKNILNLIDQFDKDDSMLINDESIVKDNQESSTDIKGAIIGQDKVFVSIIFFC